MMLFSRECRILRLLLPLMAAGALSACAFPQLPPFKWSATSPTSTDLPSATQQYVQSSYTEAKPVVLSGIKTAFTLPGHPAGPIPSDITFTRYLPIYLRVSKVDVVDAYQSPQREPYVEHLLVVSPTDAMHNWVRDRVRSVGADKTLQVIIKDASVVASALPPPPPPADGSEQKPQAPGRRYDAHLEFEMRIYDAKGQPVASFSVISQQFTSISEAASMTERKAMFHFLVAALMDDANAQIERSIFQYFGPYVDYTKTT